jgi:deoxycytidylate deaminase
LKHFDAGNPKPEIIIAIAGPVGTDLNSLAGSLTEILRAYRYETIGIKVSELIRAWCDQDAQNAIAEAKYDERINLLMNAGDAIRNKRGTGNALIPLILTSIREVRESKLVEFGYGDEGSKLELYNHCFLINSLKHPDEVRALRRIYKEKLFVISAFSGIEKRLDSLCSLIAKSEGSTSNETYRARAQKLVDKDERRHGSIIGQNLSSTFHLADFFVRCNAQASRNLDRLFKLLFGHPYITPFRDEFFMYEASGNALRSSDLSRQIGAVITNDNHDIVARGCNEVPVAGGGSYWPDRDERYDNRDYKTGRDFNNVKKDQVLRELLQFLKDRQVFDDKIDDVDVSSVTDSLIFGKHKNRFKDLRISNLIEFGRVIHAEMSALMEAARRGLAVQNGVIYTTTFPCHMCGRHIIASGIKRVVYIEPYPKSMISELFPEIVSIDSEDIPDKDSRGPSFDVVSFEPFEGVAPRVYAPLFLGGKRKDLSGYILNWEKVSAQPKLAKLSAAHLEIELVVAKEVESLPVVKHNELMLAEGTDHGDQPGADSKSESKG